MARIFMIGFCRDGGKNEPLWHRWHNISNFRSKSDMAAKLRVSKKGYAPQKKPIRSRKPARPIEIARGARVADVAELRSSGAIKRRDPVADKQRRCAAAR
jgi:hypothetical protein